MTQPITELLDRGRRHQASGQATEAEACFREILQESPDHPLAHYSLGVLDLDQGRFDEAEGHLRVAVTAIPDQPDCYLNLVNALIKLGKIDEALSVLRPAAERFPNNPAVFDGLGVTLHVRGLATEAADALHHAAHLDPKLLQPHMHLAVLHIQQRDYENASREARIALRLKPDSVEARIYLACACLNQGLIDDGISHFLMAQSLAPNNPQVAVELGKAYLMSGNPTATLDTTLKGLKANPNNTALFALQYFSLWELGREQEARTILDLDRDVFEYTMRPPSNYSSSDAFHTDLIKELAEHPTLTWEPIGKTTRKGFQTGGLHEYSLPATDLFTKSLYEQIDKIIQELPNIPGHPTLGNKPSRYRLDLWSVFLQPGGHQDHHIHPKGWCSGVYYLDIPSEISSESREGWIEFGHNPAELPLTRTPPVRWVQPVPGKLVLFPSYTYHRTVPFTGSDKRISIAFDIRGL